MLAHLKVTRGVSRSLRLYYSDPDRAAGMDRLYARFLRPGDLAFDIGAHVGDRVASFRRLGVRVVAVEPQPALARALRLLYRRDPAVVVEQSAIGSARGTLALRLNFHNPTVSTASDAFVHAAAGAPGWEGQQWTSTLEVPVTTVDALVDRHGIPRFVKIDVEGFEAEVLNGLSRPPASLSFEFTTIQREVALACVERCRALGYRAFNAALGETQELVHEASLDAPRIARWLSALPASANSGDVYAILD
jgi:FkbM family methyltransferase